MKTIGKRERDRVGEVFGKFKRIREEENIERARQPGRNAEKNERTYIRTNGEEEEKGLNIV